jgi:hypothetical protein
MSLQVHILGFHSPYGVSWASIKNDLWMLVGLVALPVDMTCECWSMFSLH